MTRSQKRRTEIAGRKALRAAQVQQMKETQKDGVGVGKFEPHTPERTGCTKRRFRTGYRTQRARRGYLTEPYGVPAGGRPGWNQIITAPAGSSLAVRQFAEADHRAGRAA